MMESTKRREVWVVVTEKKLKKKEVESEIWEMEKKNRFYIVENKEKFITSPVTKYR